MDLLTAIRVLVRHRLLTGLALTAALAVVGALYLMVPTTYSGNALVLLQVPRTGGAYQPAPKSSPNPAPPKVYNPYLSVDSSLWVLAHVIADDLTGDRTKAELEGKGHKVRYEVTPQTDIPAIGIAVTDRNRGKVVAALNDIIDIAIADLLDRQQATGVPQDTWVTATTSNVPLKMNKTRDKMMMLIVAASVALGIAVGVVFAVESLQVGARRRRSERLGPETEAPVEMRRSVIK